MPSFIQIFILTLRIKLVILVKQLRRRIFYTKDLFTDKKLYHETKTSKKLQFFLSYKNFFY